MPSIVVDSVWCGDPNADEDDPENWKNVEIPAIYVVCDYCRGEGKSSSYLGAFTQSDMDEMSEDFMDGYFAGSFDKTCEECKGLRVVLVPDRENADPKLLEEWDQREDDKYSMEREHRMEMEAEYGPNF